MHIILVPFLKTTSKSKIIMVEISLFYSNIAVIVLI